MKFVLLIVIFCALAYGASVPDSKSDESRDEKEYTLPEGIPTCSDDVDKLNECLKEVFQQMLPKLHNGNKDLKIPPIDPFALKNSKYEYSNGILSGRISLKNTIIYGMSNSIVKDVRFKFDEVGTHLEVDTFTPRVYVEGNYKADMKVNEVKMNPRGFFNVTLTDVNVTQMMDGKFEKKDGTRFLRIVNFDMVPEIGDMKIYASGLFPDPTLNAIVLDFINQYWREVYKVILPETRVYWEPLILNMMNEFMLHVPFDKLLTKSKQ